jgi:hypothetical protein
MEIHPDQKNVQLLCELADFIDSGYQSFVEQMRSVPPRQMEEAAFFVGAATSLKLIQYFASADYSREEVEFLMDQMNQEIDQYLEVHRIKIEWEPHVPASWQQ